MAFTIKQLQRDIQKSVGRFKRFQKARLLFLNEYIGSYYSRSVGESGMQPFNLLFNTVRVLVPNLVIQEPVHIVSTEITAYRPYTRLLSKALDISGKRLHLADTYRRWIVDALFMLGILKTGLTNSNFVLELDENSVIDPGTVFTEVVDFNDLVVSSSATDFNFPGYVGDRVRVPRQLLLDDDNYDNGLVEKLTKFSNDPDRTDRLSKKGVELQDDNNVDLVEIVEVWNPDEKTLISLPFGGALVEKPLKEVDYIGPDTGPYTFLQFTPPVPDNPISPSLISQMLDMQLNINRVMNKTLVQAESQRDILIYNPAHEDSVKDIMDAGTNKAVASDDPTAAQMLSFGGPNPSNVGFIQQLQSWFNVVAANTEAIGGLREESPSATQAVILNNNSGVIMEDLRSAVYSAASLEAGKRAWYLHTDPLINIPMTQRVTLPPIFDNDGRIVATSISEDVQVLLTPEDRRGDFLDYNVSIKLRSMSRLDAADKARKRTEFYLKILPAIVTSAIAAAQIGMTLSIPVLLRQYAEDLGLGDVDEVINDPVFQELVAARLAAYPKPNVDISTPGGAGAAGALPTLAGVQQQGGAVATPLAPQPNPIASQAQSGANAAQGELPVR